MTVYLDTSSLIKLFVEESGSDAIRDLVDGTLVTTSVVAYAETRAALARRRRERALTLADYSTAKRDFDAWWSATLSIGVSIELARAAGDLAERFRLRGFDAIHLATFASVAVDRGLEAVSFSSFDRALNRAADSWRREAALLATRSPARS
jgi:predicted nucleic acid-binding protein